jgi:hypothetical protein
MVDMGDDRNITEIFPTLHSLTLRGGTLIAEIVNFTEGLSMTIYSEIPARRARQLTGDFWLVAWWALSVWMAMRVNDLVMNLAAPGRAINEGATNLAASIDSAGESLGGVPLVGETLSQPFDAMSAATRFIAAAGQAQVDAVAALATFLSIALILLAVVPLASLWIPMRISFIRRASAARRFVDATEDLDLFALRAMARQPLHVLARIDADPVGAWRRGDPRVIHALATLELRDEGIRPPAFVLTASGSTEPENGRHARDLG